MRNSFIFFVFVCIATIQLNAQHTYKLLSEACDVNISGTSTIHDWEMDAKDLSGFIQLQNVSQVASLQTGKIELKVKSIESDRSLMNKKTYEALKEKDYPLIIAQLQQVEFVDKNHKAILKLNIAGVQKTIKQNITVVAKEGFITVSGKMKLKMSDFKIEPPEALMGTIKADDEVAVDFKFVFKQNKSLNK